MKTFFRSISFLAVAILALACNKNEIENESIAQQEYSYTFVIGNNSKASDTKSTFDSDGDGLFLSWDDTDALTTWSVSSVGTNGTSYSNNSEINEDQNPVTFTIKSYKALNENDTIYATYPQLSSPGSNPASVTLSIPTAQQYKAGVYDASAMPMVAAPFGISQAIENTSTGSSTESEISFYNLGSVIELGIYAPSGTYSAEKIQSIAIETTENLAGSFTFDMTKISKTDASKLDISGLSANKVTTDVGEVAVGTIAKTDPLKYYLVIAPGTYSGEITVTTDEAVYYYEFNNKSFERASVKKFLVNLEKEGARFVATSTTSTFFEETFSSCDGTGGNDNQFSGSIASANWSTSSADNSGWTSSGKVYKAQSCLRIGKVGSVTTPALGIASSSADLSFKAAAWNGSSEKTTMKVSVVGNGKLVVGENNSTTASFTIVKGSWSTLEATITGADASTKLTFSSFGSGDDRFFLDNILVSGTVTTGKARGSIESKAIDDVAAVGTTALIDLTLADFESAPSLTVVYDGTIVTNAEVTTVSSSAATISYTVAPNYTDAARSGSIEVSKGLSRGTVTINQIAPVFSLGSTSRELEPTAGDNSTVIVNCDFEWTVRNDATDYLTVTKKTGKVEFASKVNGIAAARELGKFYVVCSVLNREIEFTVTQKSAKLSAPGLSLVGDKNTKKITASWPKDDNAISYTYLVIDGDSNTIVSETTTSNNTDVSFVFDIDLGTTYYAYVKANGNNNPWLDSEYAEANETVSEGTLHEEIDLTAQGFTNQGVITTVSGTVATLTFSKNGGSNDPKYYTSGESVRTYASNKLTVSVPSGKKITKIVFTLGGTTTATITVSSGSLGAISSSSRTWTATDTVTSVDFTNGSGQMHYKGVDVFYE